MKIFLSGLLFAFLSLAVDAQTPAQDSLHRLLAVAKEDTTKVQLLVRLSWLEGSMERALQLVEEGLNLTKKLNYKKGEADCLHQLGNQVRAGGNYMLALHHYLESLKLREQLNDPEGYSRSISAIGSCYQSQEDYSSALLYYRQALAIQKKHNYNYRLAYTCSQIGETFELMNKIDSALQYFQNSYSYFTADPNKIQMVKALNGLGKIQLKLGNTELALSYYHMGTINAINHYDSNHLSRNYLGIAQLFQRTGQIDSSIHYAKSAIAVARNRIGDVKIAANKLLAQLHLGKNDWEAFEYLSVAMDAKDTSFDAVKAIQIQNLFHNERERQNEIAAVNLKANKERKRNLQYAAIALGLITFIILFLLLSHSIMTNQKLIRFLGVIALLVVFEFINLFIHPYLAHATNDSPLIMLMVMVFIAALLVPLHHRIEKWVSHKLVEKNKKIRLEAAKRTIAKLETDQIN